MPVTAPEARVDSAPEARVDSAPEARVGSAPEVSAPELALGIGAAAKRAEVSERALRYWEQIGLLHPSARTRGGMRRYSAGDLERVARIRELQDLMGFNLDEIRSVLEAEDELDRLRIAYRAADADAATQQAVIRESLAIRAALEARVETKLLRISDFLTTLRERSAHVRGLLSD